MSEFTRARKTLTQRILEREGKTPAVQRRAAFENTGLPEPLRTLIHKVAHHAYKIVDADIAAARQSGLSEDEIFELVVCAAIGQATRQYHAATAALDAVTERRSDASRNPR
jgi:alkylhydroperoxidase/carboxymuconolactone decarboxylase family protein YurZ